MEQLLGLTKAKDCDIVKSNRNKMVVVNSFMIFLQFGCSSSNQLLCPYSGNKTGATRLIIIVDYKNSI